MNDNAREWIDALTSGDYDQGRDVLHNAETNTFCCLGVACDLYQKRVGGLAVRERPADPKNDTPACTSYNGNDKSLPPRVKSWLGLRGAAGSTNGEALTELNDGGKSFDFIAGFISGEPDGLFA